MNSADANGKRIAPVRKHSFADPERERGAAKADERSGDSHPLTPTPAPAVYFCPVFRMTTRDPDFCAKRKESRWIFYSGSHTVEDEAADYCRDCKSGLVLFSGQKLSRPESPVLTIPVRLTVKSYNKGQTRAHMGV